MQKPTMTLSEVVNDLRSVGMKIKENTLSDGIASGVYSFGKILHTGKTGRRSIQILRVDYERWKTEVLFGNGADPSIPAPAPTPQVEWELISTRSYTQEDKDIIWEVIIRSWARKS